MTTITEISFVLLSNGKILKKVFDYRLFNFKCLAKCIAIMYKENVNSKFNPDTIQYDFKGYGIPRYHIERRTVVAGYQYIDMIKELTHEIKDTSSFSFEMKDDQGISFKGERLSYKFDIGTKRSICFHYENNPKSIVFDTESNKNLFYQGKPIYLWDKIVDYYSEPFETYKINIDDRGRNYIIRINSTIEKMEAGYLNRLTNVFTPDERFKDLPHHQLNDLTYKEKIFRFEDCDINFFQVC